MKHPSQEDLLGYVLGALDAQEQRDLQQLIDESPEVEERLLAIKSSLTPLDCLDAPVGARPGLARRTCELVAGLQKQHGQASRDDSRPSANRPLVESILSQSSTVPANPSAMPASMKESGNLERTAPPRSWSFMDFVIGIAACAVLAGILLPAISYTQHTSEKMACQGNMISLGRAFQCYAESNDGQFVQIPCSGKLNVSGSYAVLLKDAGFIEEDNVFACAGVDSSTPVIIPSVNQVENSCEQSLARFQRTMGGHYGYTIGHMQDDTHCCPGDMGRSFVVILADQPSQTLEGRRSRNHRGYGQNCLFEDGRVEFVRGHAYGEDSIFLNERGIVAPGCHEGDNVIAPSYLSPLPTPNVNFIE